MGKIALCADVESLKRPQLIGLDDVSLDSLDWLLLFSNAAEARISLSVTPDVDEVWVASCGGMDAINLAAGIKNDDPNKRVFLVSASSTGSSLSRSRAAGLSGTLSSESFARRFANERRVREFGLAAEDGIAGSAVILSAACSARSVAALDVAGLPVPKDHTGAMLLAEPVDALEVMPTKARKSVLVDDVEESDFSVDVKTSSVILSVVSAGGGVGKSSFAAIAATVMSRRGFKTVLVDGDLVGGDAAIVSGGREAVRFDDLLATNPSTWTSEAFPVCESGFSVVSAPEKIEVGMSLRGQLPSAAARLSELFDVVVVNADANWDEHKVNLLEASTHAVCLVGQRMSSIRLSQKVLSLCERCGIAETSVVFALNGGGKDALFTSLDLSCALQGRRVFELADGGRFVEELLGVGMPDALVNEGNSYSRSIESLLDGVLPELVVPGVAKDSGSRGFKKRSLFGRKAAAGDGKSSDMQGGRG